jgi:hypothetical protein
MEPLAVQSAFKVLQKSNTTTILKQIKSFKNLVILTPRRNIKIGITGKVRFSKFIA